MLTTARDLTARLADLLRRERASLAEFLVVLADFDARRLWRDLGHASLFYFLHRELGLSKGAAFYRATAAELIQRYPEVVEPLRDGRLCLTSVVELSKVIGPENRAAVLPRFFQLSKREARELSAEIRPAEAAPHRDVVTALRAAGPSSEAAVRTLAPAPVASMAGCIRADLVHPDEPLRATPPADPTRPEPTPLPLPVRSLPPASAEPLTGELSRLHVTVSRRFLRKLETARAALSHSHPGARTEEVLEAALDLLLDRDAKRKGLVRRPRLATPRAKAETVPAQVKRTVWQRDGGRCQWPLEKGGVCGSTRQVELDHVVPRGRGGPSTAENMRCLCRFHNQFAARQVYGDEWMDGFGRKVRAARARAERAAAP